MNDFEKQYYEAESFWDDGMVHDEFNQRRIKSTIQILPGEIKSLADIGCGNGVFLNALMTLRPELKLVGVDRSKAALKFVKTENFEADIDNLPFEDGKFDCATCLEVIEHIPVTVYPKALSELSRISKKYLVISVPYDEVLEDAYTKCPQCKTTFNRDLHLRSFNEETMKGLLADYGYDCIQIKKEGFVQKFVGHDLFRRIFYPEQFKIWQSPICPICGYSEASSKNAESQVKPMNSSLPSHAVSPKKKIISAIAKLPKRFWPKKGKHYWIIALYEKRNA